VECPPCLVELMMWQNVDGRGYFGSAENRVNAWTGKDWVDSSSIVLFLIRYREDREHTQHSAEVNNCDHN